jgi:toxin YoeB
VLSPYHPCSPQAWEEIRRSPHEGIGKPEPLKFGLAGAWSRRITDEHRLVYRIATESVEILQARYHY